MPCAPFSAVQVGFFALPKSRRRRLDRVRARRSRLPDLDRLLLGLGRRDAAGAAGAALPEGDVITEGGNKITLDDTPGVGGITLETSGGQKLKLSSTGFEIDNGKGGKISMTGPHVSINNGALEVTLMPGYVLHVGVDGASARTPARPQPTSPIPRVKRRRPAGRHPDRRRTSSPAARSPAAPSRRPASRRTVTGPARPAGGAAARCSRTASSTCAPTGTPISHRDPDAGEGDMTQVDYPVPRSTAAAARPRRRRRAHPRPGRAGALHHPGRAGQPADLRQRPAAAGVRAQQRRAGGARRS